MGVIFPLSVPGKIALILIAIFIGLIWSYFMWPDFWRKFYKRREEKKQAKEAELSLASTSKIDEAVAAAPTSSKKSKKR